MTPPPPMPMLWLALHLPLLPLEAFCATLPPADAARPVALLAEHRVSQVNGAAAERGLRPGIQRATALALAADLAIGDSHAGREAAALLAQWFPRGRGDLVLGAHATRLPALQALLLEAPVWMIDPAREHGDALQGMGLHTLSDLRALPRTGLARRFGGCPLDDLDRALGLQADPQRWLELPAAFEGQLELFARADTTEQVLHVARAA